MGTSTLAAVNRSPATLDDYIPRINGDDLPEDIRQADFYACGVVRLGAEHILQLLKQPATRRQPIDDETMAIDALSILHRAAKKWPSIVKPVINELTLASASPIPLCGQFYASANAAAMAYCGLVLRGVNMLVVRALGLRIQTPEGLIPPNQLRGQWSQVVRVFHQDAPNLFVNLPGASQIVANMMQEAIRAAANRGKVAISAPPNHFHEGKPNAKKTSSDTGMQSGKKVKGRNVEGEMRVLCAQDPERRYWTAAQFAKQIDCSESSVTSNVYWKKELASVKAQEAAARAIRGKKLDGRRKPKMPR